MWRGVLGDFHTTYHVRRRPLYARVERLSLMGTEAASLVFASESSRWEASLRFDWDITHYGMTIFALLARGLPATEEPGVVVRRR